ncbi:spore germination protein [Anaerobacillus sp. HL2]|nr:spore germination protein [Anaerobacillus sp. HL2]
MLVLFMVVLGHLASVRSFGVPYTAPIFPIYLND